MKIWIARDKAKPKDEREERYLERHPEKEIDFTELHLFYDKPRYDSNNGVWVDGRVATEIKNYMFPGIKCGECWEFNTSWGDNDIPEYMHWKGRMITEDNYNEGI